MAKIALACCLIATALLIALHADPALAQSRVFVSTTGSDSNPCTVTSPCRTFAQAYLVAATGAEIDVLTPGGYGTLSISHAISIQGHGFSGISVPSGGKGIYINAPATDAINLNGLLIDGGGVGGFGIWFFGGKSLTVENCVVRNVIYSGLTFSSEVTSATTLAVSNSYFTDNGGNGMSVSNDGQGAVTVSVDRTGFYRNAGFGLIVETTATGPLSVGVTDSVASNNAGIGFEAETESGAAAVNLSLTHSLIEGNGTGVEASGTNAAVWLAQSTLTGNTVPYNAGSSGVINSYGNNYIDTSNGTPTGSLTPVTTQ